MTPQERIAALEGMLARIHRNAARPRAAAPVVAAPAAAPAPAPVVQTAADAAFDRTVDELLEAPIPQAHAAPQQASAAVQPISLEPPPPAYSQEPPAREELTLEPEEAAIPLISAAAADMPAMSGVQLVGQAAEDEVDVVVEAGEAEELGEDDLISVPPEARSVPPPAVQIPAHDDLDFDEEEEAAAAAEEVPASSKRARVAETMEEAMAAAPEALDEREVPIKTPPPESGPQEAMPPAAALESPRLPDIREAFGGPTPEQLGETIELPEPSNANLELDVRTPEPSAAEPVSEELEVALPTREAPSAFDANLSPPESAREEIRRYDEQAAGDAGEPLEATAVVRRREIAGATVARVLSKAGDFTPKTFLELLEASLRLGSE